jgi:hypothetical protein
VFRPLLACDRAQPRLQSCNARPRAAGGHAAHFVVGDPSRQRHEQRPHAFAQLSQTNEVKHSLFCTLWFWPQVFLLQVRMIAFDPRAGLNGALDAALKIRLVLGDAAGFDCCEEFGKTVLDTPGPVVYVAAPRGLPSARGSLAS